MRPVTSRRLDAARPWQLLALLGALLMLLPAAQASPTDTVQTTIDAVLAALNDPDSEDAARRARAVALIARHFDFEDMTRRTLATNWDKADAAQRARIVALFRELLVNTYRTQLAAYRNQKVEILAEESRGEDTATVRTLIHARAPVPVDYKLHRTHGAWLAYDVVIEQVSLVRNYRGAFLDAVHDGGIEGLIAHLEARVQEASS